MMQASDDSDEFLVPSPSYGTGSRAGATVSADTSSGLPADREADFRRFYTAQLTPAFPAFGPDFKVSGQA
jgi:hypothetical protein